jgi:Barrel-sandwich domain of CusB or HlyD membrane-fusion
VLSGQVRLNLSYTKVFAPVDGYVTNMNTSEGTYVTAGSQLIALVDTSSYWVAGYFKEIQLPHIKVSQMANITMMGYENQPFQGVVRRVGWGIYVRMDRGALALPCYHRSIRPLIGFASRNVFRFASRSSGKLRSRCGLDKLFRLP